MTTHVVPIKTYLTVFFGLIVLTLATTGIAHLDLGPFNTLVAFLIAAAKTLLVVLFFMHMKWSSYRMKVVAVGGLVWLAILIMFTVSDYLTRNWMGYPGHWPQPPQAQTGFLPPPGK